MREPSTLARLTRLLAEMAIEMAALDQLAAELAEIRTRWPAMGGPDRPTLVIACVDLHGYYTALETLLERVARMIDEEVPSGPAWHAELITQAALEIPTLRPAVIPASIVGDLHELRRFRHFFRNAYVIEPDPARVRGHVDRLLDMHRAVSASLTAFREHLEHARAALSR